MRLHAGKEKKPQTAYSRGAIDKELRISAGLPIKGASSVDPVSFIRSRFTESFLAHGRNEAAFWESKAQDEREGAKEREADEGAQVREEERLSMSPGYQTTKLQAQEGVFVHKFSQTAFSRGSLAAGILDGKGKMLLLTTMKQAIGVSLPTNARQRQLMGDSSVHNRLPGSDANVIFNRDEIRSAVGLVVDSINSGTNILKDMKAALNNLSEETDIQTLRSLYPYLDVERDKAQRERYREELKKLSANDSVQKAALDYGIRKMEAMIEKKQFMQQYMINELDRLSANAIRMELTLEKEDTIEWLYNELKDAHSLDEEPRQDGDLLDEDEKNVKKRNRRSGKTETTPDGTA